MYCSTSDDSNCTQVYSAILKTLQYKLKTVSNDIRTMLDFFETVQKSC